MLTITGCSAEYIKDPFEIIPGKRYEFILDLEIEEDDELYHENGVYVRLIYSVQEDGQHIVKHELFERVTNRYLAFDLEPEELQGLQHYCSEHLPLDG